MYATTTQNIATTHRPSTPKFTRRKRTSRPRTRDRNITGRRESGRARQIVEVLIRGSGWRASRGWRRLPIRNPSMLSQPHRRPEHTNHGKEAQRSRRRIHRPIFSSSLLALSLLLLLSPWPQAGEVRLATSWNSRVENKLNPTRPRAHTYAHKAKTGRNKGKRMKKEKKGKERRTKLRVVSKCV